MEKDYTSRMTELLRRLFIKDYKNIGDPKVRERHGRLASIFGIVTNLVLIALKVGAAVLVYYESGILSAALMADAVNNVSDMATSLVSLFSFRLAGKPADKDHPFGHERVEYISGLVISVIVLMIGATLLQESITKVIEMAEASYDLVAVIILAVSVFLKVFQGFVYRGLGKAISSESLKASSLDSWSDSVSTFLILVAGVLSYTLHWDNLDGYMGIVASLFVIVSGAKMLKDTASPLIGNPMKKEVVDEILQEAKKDPRILGVHDLLLHDYGPTKRFVSFHAEVDSRMDFLEAHEMIDDLEESLRDKYGLNVSIHMDPILVGDEETERTKNEVLACLKELDPALKIHDFRLVDGKGHANVLFDVVLPFDGKLSEQEILDALKSHFANREKAYNLKVTFDRPFTE